MIHGDVLEYPSMMAASCIFALSMFRGDPSKRMLKMFASPKNKIIDIVFLIIFNKDLKSMIVYSDRSE